MAKNYQTLFIERLIESRKEKPFTYFAITYKFFNRPKKQSDCFNLRTGIYSCFDEKNSIETNQKVANLV